MSVVGVYFQDDIENAALRSEYSVSCSTDLAILANTACWIHVATNTEAVLLGGLAHSFGVLGERG